MADTEISRLPPLLAEQLSASDVLPIADVSLLETKKVRADELVSVGVNLLPPDSIDSSQIDFSTLQPGEIDGSAIADRSLVAAQLALNTLTAEEIAPNAIGSSELANGAVDTAALLDGNVTPAKIEANSLTADQIANNAIGTLELADASVTNAKLSIDPNSIEGSVLRDNSVGEAQLTPDLPGSIIVDEGIDTAQLAPQSVTAEKLGISSVTNDALADGAVTDAKVTDVDGSKLNDQSVGAGKLDPAGFNQGIQVDGTGADAAVGHVNIVPATTRNGITWDANGHITNHRPLEASEIPIASDSSLGGIVVPQSSGLTVDGAGNIDHITLITQGTTSGITYDDHGHITNAVPLVSDDLPRATTTEKGAVSVPPDQFNPLTVGADGELRHADGATGPLSGLCSIQVDRYGHIVDGDTVLQPDQVPGLPADRISSGQFPTNRIEDNAITLDKLADYSISFIQEAEPPITSSLHVGMLWFQESTAQLRMWNGNSFFAVGFGRLSQENLRWCGTVNAATGLITTLNDAGRRDGFVVGEPIPAATDALSGAYFVIDEPGSSIGVLSGTTFSEGDWCLCIDKAGGWIRIDVTSGGGGAVLLRLNDLLDVDINNPEAGDALFFDPNTNNWTNQSTGIIRVSMTPAFDGTLTSFTLSQTITSVNNVTISLGGVIQEPGIDYNIASGTNTITFSDPPPTGTTYFMTSINPTSGGGGGGGGGGTDLPPGTSANEVLGWDNDLGSWRPTAEIVGGTY